MYGRGSSVVKYAVSIEARGYVKNGERLVIEAVSDKQARYMAMVLVAEARKIDVHRAYSLFKITKCEVI